jgi:SAM-dependent methyltransferase
MKPLWFPMSALLDGELDCWASPVMLRMPLAAGQTVRLRYVGDQMWPAFAHGQTIEVSPVPANLLVGAVVVALFEGNLELWRVAAATDRTVSLTGDANGAAPIKVERGAVIGAVPESSLASGPTWLRWFRRARLELEEARTGLSGKRADSVLRKYDRQAADYASQQDVKPSPGWSRTIKRHLCESGHMLVVGSGTGWECRALAGLGYSCVGLDFSSRMIEHAERLLAGSGLEQKVRFRIADVREFEPEPGEFDGVLFTPDVYSFLPRSRDRSAVLGRLASGLPSRGRILLNARVVEGLWARIPLLIQWLKAERQGDLGDSHTRFLSPDGTIHRSFVHCFSERSLHREIARAGLQAVAVERGFHVLAPHPNRGRPA